MGQRTAIHSGDITNEKSLDLVASTVTPAIMAMPIVNPDGSNIAGGSGGSTLADVTSTGNLTAVSQTVVLALTGHGGGAATITGTFVGTFAVQGSEDGGVTYSSINIPVAGVGILQTSSNTTGLYRFGISGFSHIQVICLTYVSGTIGVHLRASAQAGGVFLTGNLPNSTAYSHLKTTLEPRTLFYDPFEGGSIDTTNRWVTPTGTNAPTIAASQLTFPQTAGAGNFGKLTSQPTFNAIIPGFLQPSFALQVEAVPALNAHRFWGVGTSNATPTTASPLIDAIGFEIDVDGKLKACVYQSGTRIFATDLSSTGTGYANNQQPLDGIMHRYLIQIRTDRIFWYVADSGGVNNAVATAIFQVPNTQIMPILHQTINPVAQTGTPVYKVQGSVVADTAGNHTQNSDGTYPWRKQTVKANGAAAVADDYTNQQNQHVTLTANTDTTITFSPAVRAYKVLNWDIANRVLYSQTAIATNTDATAARVGFAAAVSVPNSSGTIPLTTTTVHVRSAAASEVTVIGLG